MVVEKVQEVTNSKEERWMKTILRNVVFEELRESGELEPSQYRYYYRKAKRNLSFNRPHEDNIG